MSGIGGQAHVPVPLSGLKSLVGKSLRYVAELDGRWLALLGWAASALKCQPGIRGLAGLKPSNAAVTFNRQ